MPTDDGSRKHRRRSPTDQHRSRARSRSPTHHPHGHHHRQRDREAERETKRTSKNHPDAARPLPFGARRLAKDDHLGYKTLFAQYLDLQKQIILSDLTSDNVKGRWKSFLKKWNRGELAEGWYDPETLRKSNIHSMQSEPRRNLEGTTEQPNSPKPSSSDDEGPGPYMDSSFQRAKEQAKRAGPSIPSLQELELKREQEGEDADEAYANLRRERQANRTAEKERLDELAPKAMAGTKERQMEKRREQAGANRNFAEAKTGDSVVEVNDAELMGGEDDGVESYKKQLKDMERKKSEREIRREEIMRARREERQQRAQEIQDREARTMEGLIELAKQRFG